MPSSPMALAEGRDRLPRQAAQAGVEDGRVLALQQTDAADLAGDRSPMRPGTSAAMIAAASCSMPVLTGEKTEETATAVIPLAAMIGRDRACISSASSGEISRPSNS